MPSCGLRLGTDQMIWLSVRGIGHGGGSREVNDRKGGFVEWAELMACGTQRYGEGPTEYKLERIRFEGCQFLGKVNWQSGADVKRL